ncbi:hypothetical protein PUNSTDRAFT_49805 [Punctularia strigosozonata HHB-11173 SS5]|uniref:uncharacterized protein n=1 Tax=Punctularia strigosozonata (strain HHB-11173) TaxID=741275 RepID=UPI00044165F4|nr:uncharacterized protein PUNSTDRAFT_49805 [Punctularia strigosozonata HHB-11173 SS5]EIN12497.1 hypothetical protein PUNSTDRAFT_49805 [Punctularia strigosozonata HHB-11173 SS5]
MAGLISRPDGLRGKTMSQVLGPFLTGQELADLVPAWAFIRETVRADFTEGKRFSKQSAEVKAAVIEKVTNEYPIFERFEGAWPIERYITHSGLMGGGRRRTRGRKAQILRGPPTEKNRGRKVKKSPTQPSESLDSSRSTPEPIDDSASEAEARPGIKIGPPRGANRKVSIDLPRYRQLIGPTYISTDAQGSSSHSSAAKPSSPPPSSPSSPSTPTPRERSVTIAPHSKHTTQLGVTDPAVLAFLDTLDFPREQIARAFARYGIDKARLDRLCLMPADRLENKLQRCIGKLGVCEWDLDDLTEALQLRGESLKRVKE